MLKSLLPCLFFLILTLSVAAQPDADKKSNGWSTHFQSTIITQKHPAFRALYSGINSLTDTVEPAATSLTATLFIGRKLWKGAELYFNPEASGGRGLSSATGVAGALNGETYRIGNPEPTVHIARFYFTQYFRLGDSDFQDYGEGINQVADNLPVNYLAISAGKFSVTDFFDNNQYSKDPRTQFFNWSLWGNGAWDYPADTRGYTMGIVLELVRKNWAIRFSSVAVPAIANSTRMEYRIPHANSETFEVQHKLLLNRRPGNIRMIVFANFYRGPSYVEGIKAIKTDDQFLLNVLRGIDQNPVYGGRKIGSGLNIEQELSDYLGLFCRAGWNDGKYASWAFTEIDRTISAGISMKGNYWRRSNDVLGLAAGLNGISTDHRNFLKEGGYGFIIGDGNLNYGPEQIVEIYYSIRLIDFLRLTLDYQFVRNPAYNKDRGPVNAFGIRGHIEF